MITTNETKDASVSQGFYQSGSGPEEILLVGSCRTVPFLSYLRRWNDTIGNNRFTIRRIDPCELLEQGIEAWLQRCETDERILNILCSCDIFIHEYLVNYGMFNTNSITAESGKNIYQFGMCTDIDISIPNFNDHMILKNDWVDYGAETPPDWIARGEAEIEKFCGLCDLTSFPEFGIVFRETWRKVRYFWRPNHTSAAFTTQLFRLMNEKYLHLETTNEFWDEIGQWDLFKEPCTIVTQEDVDGYQLLWR